MTHSLSHLELEKHSPMKRVQRDRRSTSKLSCVGVLNFLHANIRYSYLHNLSAKAIDQYIELRAEEQSGTSKEKIDPRLQNIIEGIFQRCIAEGEYKQVRICTYFTAIGQLLTYLPDDFRPSVSLWNLADLILFPLSTSKQTMFPYSHMPWKLLLILVHHYHIVTMSSGFYSLYSPT